MPITMSKKELIAHHFREIMEALGLDLNSQGLKETPGRVAKMYVDELFSGLEEENYPEMTSFENPTPEESNLVLVKTQFHSICEHHFLPMRGMAFVAYLPHKKLLGLSKIPRLVEHLARRPQLQERLTAQIADHISFHLETEHVAVSLTGEHFCVMARGVEDVHSQTVTHVLRGDFRHKETLRREFFEAINQNSLQK